MAKDYIPEGAERRFFTPEVRQDEEGTISGVAAVVNKTTDLGIFQERIAPGAFDDVMKDDVVALFNHDPNYPLARTGSGTLKLGLNKNGDLTYKFKTPNRQWAKDLDDAIRTGDVNKSSFAFTIKDEEWQYANEERETDLRIIKKIGRLYDVSPVTYPAYNDTSVTGRAMETLEKHYQEIEEEKKKAKEDAFERDSIMRDLDL